MLDEVIGGFKKLIWLGLVCGLLSSSGYSASLEDEVDRGLEAIRDGKWSEAEALFKGVVAKVEAADPRKGVVLYHLGYAQLKMAIEAEVKGDEEAERKWLEAAAASLLGSSEIGARGNAINIYERRALLQLGVVRQKQGKFGLAIENYEEFLLKRDQLRDVYDRGVLLVNLAICNVSKKEADGERARKLFLEAVTSEAGSGMRVREYMRGFSVVVERGFGGEGWGDLADWIVKVGEAYDVKEGDEAEWSEAILSLAYKAAEVKAWEVGLGLCELISAEAGEECLYRMIRGAGIGEESEVVLKLSASYLERLAEGKYREEVLVMMMEAYRERGEYDEMGEAAKLYLGEEGGRIYLLEAYYFGAKYAEALKLSRSLVAESGGELKGKVLFFEGASLARLQFWKEAGVVLDRYLAVDGELEYRGLAMYERAVVSRKLGDVERAVEFLDGALEGREESALAGYVFNLLGNIEQSRREREKAEANYVRALGVAKKLKNDELEQESLFYLVEMLGQEYVGSSINSDVAKALPYVDEFLAKYRESKYAAQVLVAAYPAMRDAGRLAEYLEVIQPVLVRFAESDRTPGLELAVNSYARALQASGKTMSEVGSILLDDGQSLRTRAVMRDGLATIYGDLAEKSWGAMKVARAMRYEAMVAVLYAEFWSEWPVKAMPPYVALKVASFLSERGGEVSRVRGFYDEVRVRGILSERIEADLGLGALLVRGGEDLEVARGLLKGVIERDEYAGEAREEAYLSLAKLYEGREDWKLLGELGQEYLGDDRQNVKFRAEFTYYLALSSYRLGKLDSAIVLYGRVYASHLSKLEVSALAVRDLIELTWERNSNREAGAKADRQVAYRLGQRYVSMTRDLFERRRGGLAAEVVEAWLEIEKKVAVWEKSGEVRTVEELLEDRRRGRKSFR